MNISNSPNRLAISDSKEKDKFQISNTKQWIIGSKISQYRLEL